MAQNTNNPYHKTARKYDRKLRLPIIKQIRGAERRKITQLLDEVLRPSDRVLELGCGNGYYTVEIARRVRDVIALDDSEKMLDLLEERLKDEGIGNVQTVHSEATEYKPVKRPDAVVHIGVLDYVKNWSDFLGHSFATSRRVVLFTCPAKGLWGRVFQLTARFEKSRIQVYKEKDLRMHIRDRFPEWQLRFYRVGLHGLGIKGMTWVVVGIKN